MRINKIILLFVLLSHCCLIAFGQTTDNNHSTKSNEIVFNEGIYLTFSEFQKNSPSIKEFEVKRLGKFGRTINLEYKCFDSISKQITTCIVKNCWAYVSNKTLFISQGEDDSFFRAQIIGALIHYFALETTYEPMHYDYRYGGYYPNTMGTSRRTVSNEYIIIFETGEQFLFTYRNFANFLKQNDTELYQELEKSKRKRKMIYHFLLRYNEKYPLSIN